MNDKWLSTIVGYYNSQQSKMLLGPVCYYNDDNLFKKLQTLEFLSLIATSAGAAKLRMPVMCNAANMAFERNTFLEVNGYEINKSYTSGDDVFLMNSINKKYPGSVQFMKDKDAIVYTEAKETINDFISQRKRWVSKTKGIRNTFIMYTALSVYLFNLSLLILIIFNLALLGIPSLKGMESVYYLSILYLAKCLIDYPILAGVTGFMNKKKLMKYFLALEIINIFYVSLIGIIGNVSKFKWKGRQN